MGPANINAQLSMEEGATTMTIRMLLENEDWRELYSVLWRAKARRALLEDMPVKLLNRLYEAIVLERLNRAKS